MDTTQALRLAIQITIFVTLFAAGLATSTEDLRYLQRRPGLLARSLLATVVITPILAIGLSLALHIGQAAGIAIIAGSLAPGLPTLPKAGAKAGGRPAFACSLLLLTSVLGVVTVPLWLELLRRFAHIEVDIAPGEIARVLGLAMVLPLGLGIAIRRAAPAIAPVVTGPVTTFANALLPGLVLVVLLIGGPALFDLGWRALIAMLLVPLLALAIGHVLGGPDPGDRTVLAIANAGRFPMLAAFIAATAFPEVHALPAVIAYLVVANLVAMPYRSARKRAHDAAPKDSGLAPGPISVPVPSH